jgi:uncharacterized membrane protein
MVALFKKYRWLGPSLLFTITLLALRVAATHTLMFCFLPWNLFLAALPLLFAEGVNNQRGKKPHLVWLYGGLWLLFFPNALYITTNLFHPKRASRSTRDKHIKVEKPKGRMLKRPAL